MKKICILGGGNGTSRLVKGFINKDVFVDVIITSSDNGGHTGKLLKEFDVPPLGDLRHVLESLVQEPLATFLKYRFDKLHNIENVSLGNLMLLSLFLNDGSRMIENVNKMINSNFKLHLSNSKYLELVAKDKNGKIIRGETLIGKCTKIKDLFFEENPKRDIEVERAIKDADIIILSFGSFYTSLGAVIANKYISKAIKNSKAKLVYLPNLINQTETSNYVIEDYLEFLKRKIGRDIDEVLISNNIVDGDYDKNLIVKAKNDKAKNYRFHPLTTIEDGKLRHDVMLVSRIILEE